MSDTDIGVVTFAFGSQKTPSNEKLFEITKMLARIYGAPVFTQPDIIAAPDAKEIDVELINEGPNNPSSTLKMAEAAVKWARRRRLKRLVIVAAKPHVSRCHRDMMKTAKGTVDIRVNPCRDGEKWFYSESTQAWTRSPLLWKMRETVLMSMPFWLYRRICYARDFYYYLRQYCRRILNKTH